MKLENVILPARNTSQQFDIEIERNTIHSIRACSNTDSAPRLLLPPLCHPHIHLDKAFILTSNSDHPDFPDYSDLVPETGEFQEALAKTGAAKSRYTHADLLRRGEQLIAESIQAGVTAMRAFVEVDHVTQFKCVEAAVELKQKFEDICHVQICVFAQDPVFSTEHGEENRRLMEAAIEKFRDHIDVIGSTPYVEQSGHDQVRNIEWAVRKALDSQLHLDLHLDYNLNEHSESFIWPVINELSAQKWTKLAKDLTVVIGHCSRITLFGTSEIERLASAILKAELPVSFVGLPTSDIFMMGRPSDSSEWGSRPRGTLQILQLIKQFHLNACIGINNVGNAFTPWGSLDPLKLASLAVGLYQAGTPKDAAILYECVSSRARQAIGLPSEEQENMLHRAKEGAKGPFLLVRNQDNTEVAGDVHSIPARPRLDIKDVVWDPPDVALRELILS